MTGIEFISRLTSHFRQFSTQNRKLLVMVPNSAYTYTIDGIRSTPLGEEILLKRVE